MGAAPEARRPRGGGRFVESTGPWLAQTLLQVAWAVIVSATPEEVAALSEPSARPAVKTIVVGYAAGSESSRRALERAVQLAEAFVRP